VTSSSIAARAVRVRRALLAKLRPARTAPTGPQRGDKAFTAVSLAVGALVAVIAFSASYQHQYELDIFYRQTHWVAALLPLSVDGLIAAAGLVIWYAARHGYPRPLRAYLALVAGVSATAVTNLAADHHYDWPWLGPAISVWPAAAFVAAYEMTVWLVRKNQERARSADDSGRSRTAPDMVPSPGGTAPADAETAALASLRATLAAGNPWSQNQLSERFGLTRAQATRVRRLVLAGANGHDSDSDAGSTT
jgi:hypothetical protein